MWEIMNMHTGDSQWFIVIRFEGCKVFGVLLCASIAPIQFGFKEYAHFRYNSITFFVLFRRYLYRSKQVLFSITSKYTYWELTTS